MPIILKTPLSVGDLDPAAKNGYPHLQIVQIAHAPLIFSASLQYEYGTASGDHFETWTKGDASPTKTVEVSPQQLLEMWGQMPQDKETAGEAMRRLCYQFLIDQKIADGTVANNPPLPPADTMPADGETVPDAPKSGSPS